MAKSLHLLRSASVKYRRRIKGGNSRLDEPQGHPAWVKLSHVEESNRPRAECAGCYRELPTDVPRVSVLIAPSGDRSQVWYVFNTRHQRRDQLRSMLEQERIGTTTYHFESFHLAPAYGAPGYARGDFPVTQEFVGRSLALAFDPHLRLDEPETVVDSVRRSRTVVSS
jgi:dTDP-4-amino-4,6-dideoxygalactose transaminase